MKIEITRAFGPHSVGALLPDVPGNLAREWIRRGVAKEITEEARVDRQMKSGRGGRRDYVSK